MYAYQIGSLGFALSLLLLIACATDQPVQQQQLAKPSEQQETPSAYEAEGERITARSGSTAAGSTTAAQADVFAAMKGRWVSESDPKEEVVFAPDSYTTYYDGRQVIQEDLTLHAACPEVCSVGNSGYDGPCFIVSGEFDATCYALVRADRSVLEISLLGGTGETLRYLRKD